MKQASYILLTAHDVVAGLGESKLAISFEIKNTVTFDSLFWLSAIYPVDIKAPIFSTTRERLL